ncbi:hypothetical protein HanXRQr2_Chr07g0296151 [Helianthus annuus]|uniref:Uncharacterized protein n=1 Tax=Helianthus annuus TaxID=4232 RepID=A0A251RZK3_HELAN|nr:hypothetical protein HanXRQr2_Chr07g0296151 [Helianthus annuus]KAJ0904819.1 hypothetical protein HanPSC8_Chr07g0286691 [Helianthus annuus]
MDTAHRAIQHMFCSVRSSILTRTTCIPPFAQSLLMPPLVAPSPPRSSNMQEATQVIYYRELMNFYLELYLNSYWRANEDSGLNATGLKFESDPNRVLPQ